MPSLQWEWIPAPCHGHLPTLAARPMLTAEATAVEGGGAMIGTSPAARSTNAGLRGVWMVGALTAVAMAAQGVGQVVSWLSQPQLPTR